MIITRWSSKSNSVGEGICGDYETGRIGIEWGNDSVVTEEDEVISQTESFIGWVSAILGKCSWFYSTSLWKTRSGTMIRFWWIGYCTGRNPPEMQDVPMIILKRQWNKTIRKSNQVKLYTMNKFFHAKIIFSQKIMFVLHDYRRFNLFSITYFSFSSFFPNAWTSMLFYFQNTKWITDLGSCF